MRTLGVLIKVDGLPIDVTVMRRMLRAHARADQRSARGGCTTRTPARAMALIDYFWNVHELFETVSCRVCGYRTSPTRGILAPIHVPPSAK